MKKENLKRSQTLMSTQQESFKSQIADVNLDILKINKKLNQYTSYQEHIDSVIQEESKLRQNIEKKTFLMNENLTEQITKLKSSFDNLSTTMMSHIETIKDEILVDVRNNNSKFLSTFESNIKRFDEYEKHLTNAHDEKSLAIQEVENKLSVIEEVTGNQFTIIKNEIDSSKSKINAIQNQMSNNTNLITNEISTIKKDIISIKNEIEKINNGRTILFDSVTKVTNDISTLNTKNEKINHEMSLIIKDVQSKLKHYETVNKMLNETFISVKNDVLLQIEDITKVSNESYNKLRDNLLNELKQTKVEIDKFHINIIQENQKFIDFTQAQMKSQNDSVKQLIDYTNDDIDVLKKKSDTLENIVKNLRTEMINNINGVEGFLTQRYDSIFRAMSSDRS